MGLVEEKAGSRPERPPVLARYLYTPYGEAHGEVGPKVREVKFEASLTSLTTEAGTVTQVVADEGKAAKGGLRITMALPVDATTLGEGVRVEKLVPGEGWKPVSQSEVMVAPTRAPPDHTAEDLPPGIDILALAGWPRGVSFRVRLTQALADLAGRPLAEEQSVVWSIPEGRDEVVFAQTFPVSYDTIQAASDTLGGAIPGGQTLLFHGLWTDPATGLAYARNRWYDPRTASWLSEDPLRDLDSPNLYAYVSWQPQMYRDPMGTCRWNDWECWGWVAEEFGKNIVTDPNAQSTALGFTPVVGDIKDWQEAITGVDLITGERLAWWERGATVVAGLAPVVSGKGLRELAGLKKLADQPALPPGRVAKALPAGHAPKALPGWKLPVAYDPRVKRWRDLQTGQFTKPPIVIGENMERVREYARQIGAQTIEDFVTEWSFGANREWIRQMKAEGRQVIDTGPDFARRVERLEKGKVPWSDVYNMERMELKGYGNYKRVFRRFGKWRGGVPGLDKS
uniref:Pre-toxin TG domain-containing protein n=1 Tax=Thermoanaerobaculum aquaticum TaxID=1312852 RepID=A0A7V1ZHS0_9BACT